MKFREKIRGEGYKNQRTAGLQTAELISIEPVTLKTEFLGTELRSNKFYSLVSLEGLKEEDVGEKRYLVYIMPKTDFWYIFAEDNGKEYREYYVEKEE